MSRQAIIARTIDRLKKLPDQELQEVSDFAEFLLSKLDDQILTEGIQKLSSESKSFQFLEEEPELYNTKDLKEKYK